MVMRKSETLAGYSQRLRASRLKEGLCSLWPAIFADPSFFWMGWLGGQRRNRMGNAPPLPRVG